VLAGDGADAILVTHDGRATSPEAARAVAAAAARFASVTLARRVPTPTATFAVRSGRFDAALLVTASHNPAGWNGIKLKVAPGLPPGAELERRVEEHLAAAGDQFGAGGAAVDVWSAERVRGLEDAHHRSVAAGSVADRPPISVVLDGVHGIAGAGLARLCRTLGWRVRAVRTVPRADFGGLTPDPVRAATRALVSAEVVRAGADFGIILDGDGDRIWIVGHDGRAILPHDLFALLLHHRSLWEKPDTRRGVAVTVSCGSIVSQICAEQGRPVAECPIGFKYIAPLLADGAAGAGAVGDLAFARFGRDRDPAIAIVLIDLLVAATGQPRIGLLAARLAARHGPRHWAELHLPRVRLGPARAERAVEALGLPVQEISRVDGSKFRLPDGQWLLIRPSSTEGGTRVFSEMLDPDRQRTLLARLTQALEDRHEP
jgi:phosphomannomutase